mgnify:CR=1 FL=1
MSNSISKYKTYIFTLLITFGLGFVVTFAVYFIKDYFNHLERFETIQIFIEFLMASTFSYVFLTNFSKLFEKDGSQFFWAPLTVILVIIYIVFYILYQLLWTSYIIMILVILLTIGIMYLDFKAYNEYITLADDKDKTNAGNAQLSA